MKGLEQSPLIENVELTPLAKKRNVLRTKKLKVEEFWADVNPELVDVDHTKK